MNVVLVEDDDVDAMTVERAFSRLSAQVCTFRAKNGVDALLLLRSDKVDHPHVILLDLNMPKMNGLEFLQALRADSALRHEIVFVLTTSRNKKDVDACYALNVAGYFTKEQWVDASLGLPEWLVAYWKNNVFCKGQ